MRPRCVQSKPQQIAQLREHDIGGLHVFVHYRRNRIQRVEEKMRLQLKTQILQLRFGKLRLQVRRGKLLSLGQPEALKVIVEPDDTRETDQVVGEFHRIAI